MATLNNLQPFRSVLILAPLKDFRKTHLTHLWGAIQKELTPHEIWFTPK